MDLTRVTWIHAVFKYSPAAHDVLEVSKADHDSCTASRPLATFATGDDTVPLPAGGVTRVTPPDQGPPFRPARQRQSSAFAAAGGRLDEDAC